MLYNVHSSPNISNKIHYFQFTLSFRPTLMFYIRLLFFEKQFQSKLNQTLKKKYSFKNWIVIKTDCFKVLNCPYM